jgi:hypothetical protein
MDRDAFMRFLETEGQGVVARVVEEQIPDVSVAYAFRTAAACNDQRLGTYFSFLDQHAPSCIERNVTFEDATAAIIAKARELYR